MAAAVRSAFEPPDYARRIRVTDEAGTVVDVQVADGSLRSRVATAANGRAVGDIVLLHGFVVSARYMLPLAIRFASTHRVHVPDLPGFGLSRSPRLFGLRGLADAAAAWIVERGLAGAPVVANSVGCQIATWAAIRHRATIGALVLVSPTLDPGARIPAASCLRTSPEEPWQLNVIIARDYLDAGARRAVSLARAVLADRIEERLPQLELPCLVIRGARDAIVTQDWAERAAALAGAQLVVIDGAHALNFSAASRLAEVVRGFLSPLRPRPASPCGP